MKILVCIKEVAKEVKSFNKDGYLERENVKTRLNKKDLYALEQGLKLKTLYGAEVLVLSMGDNSAKDVIREAISMGVDKGYLLSDYSLKGSDTIATTRALVEAIEYLGKFDLILLGSFASDSKSGVIGGMIGEKLSYETIQNTCKILTVERDTLVVSTEIDSDLYKIKAKFPIILTIKESNEIPRFPNYIDFLRAEKEEIKVITVEDFVNREKDNYGYKGSDIAIASIENVEVLNDKKEENEFIAKKRVYEGTNSELTEILENTLKDLEFVL